jgi:hypothetical protein
MKRTLPAARQYIDSLKDKTEVRSLRLSLNFEESVLPPELEDWLSKLSLLYGVPFEHMVPNAEMLPTESMRFFYVDPNWVSCLVDGALSVGTHSSRDVVLVETVYAQIQQSLKAGMQLVRGRLAKAVAPQEVTTEVAAAGLLIRSQLISGWPGLEIAAYENYTIDPDKAIIPGTKIINLRIERLAPDVMLCLFAKLPKLVQLNEPKEGLCFGARSNGKIVPRYLGYHPNQPVGKFVTGNPQPGDETQIFTRAGGKGVIDIAATKKGLIDILKKYNALSASNDLTPADFAIELLKSAEQQSFLSGEIENQNPHDCKDY